MDSLAGLMLLGKGRDIDPALARLLEMSEGRGIDETVLAERVSVVRGQEAKEDFARCL